MAAGGSATGVRNNKQPVIRNGRDVNADGMVDAYEEMGYQTADAKDDVATALQKKIANLEAALPTPSVLTEDLGAAWEGLGGNNSVGSAFRDKGSLDVLMGSRGLLSVMTGMSEALDQYLQRTVPENRFDPVTGQPDMFFLFEMMRKKHKETLTEFEREAELMLGGSVAILAIPQIIEKLIEMGVNPMLARSLEGPLNKLIKECKKKDDELHSLYMMIKEEAELSVRPEEEEQQAV